VGTPASVQVSATGSASGQALTYSASGLPAGLSLSSSTGLISGAPATAQTSSVTVTATDATGASGSASFTRTVDPASTVTVTSPGSQAGTVGAAVSLQIHATGPASGQALTCSASGLPAGLSISSSTGLISGTPATTQTSSVTVTAAGATGASGSASFTWTISPGSSGCTPAQLPGNPGFETGRIAPWTATSHVLANTSEGVPAHPGSWLAWFDGYGTLHTDKLTQTVTIPSTCKNASLTFWLDIATNDPPDKAYDTFKVQVLNPSGVALATLGQLSNLNTTGHHTQNITSLNRFTGQTIKLKFTGKQTLGGGCNTSFFEDGNALNVS